MGEEKQQKCSTSSGGGGGSRVSKKPKPKKIPQRGLGVEQLEKIRIEEQHKNNPAASAANLGSSSFPFAPHSQHRNQSSSSIPFHQQSSTELRSFRPHFSVFGASSAILGASSSINPPPLPSQPVVYGQNSSNPLGGGGSTIERHSCLTNVLNSSEFSYDKEGYKVNHGLVFQTHLHSELNPIGSSSILMQRQNEQQQQNHSIKMIGMKRPWPFSLDNQPTPSFQCNFPMFVPPICGLDERSPRENGGTLLLEPGKSSCRDGPPGLSEPLFDWRAGIPDPNWSNGSKEYGAIDTVLTLGLPTATSSSTTTKPRQPLEISAYTHPEVSDFNTSPLEEYYGEPVFQRGVLSTQSQHFYCFFPPKSPQISHMASNSRDQRSKISDAVDLNLRL
ncbi:hypothetical protein IFM89_014564 [Coptis chinensis]|uniref:SPOROCYTELESS-like EAR-containing protein 2 n=1 Tax=Coptis chinensis TaxID=261450 RepID=A0A835H0V2_9MAGN|nr:hypothetical protein IFM89_014564 [Coptis chinensis]